MSASGKFYVGNAVKAKLDAGVVREIRQRWATGRITQGELSRQYGVTSTQIGRIVRGESWQHVPTVMTEGEEMAMTQRLLKLQAEINGEDPPAFVSLQTKLADDVAREKAKAFLGDDMVEELKSVPVNPMDE